MMRIGDTRKVTVVLCNTCGTAYQNPQLDEAELERLWWTRTPRRWLLRH